MTDSLPFRRVLVTGADGFIGSHLTELLVRRGYAVRAFALYNSFGSLGWLDHCAADIKGAFEVVTGDVRDPHGAREAVRDCDCVLHLAALIAIPHSYRSPDAYVDTNVRGTLNLLGAARDFGVAKFVHTSTSEVYGTARYVPIDEEHPLSAQSPYAATKIAADQLALSFHASFGTPVAVLRPFNTYGPRQSTRAVLPTLITQMLSGSRRVAIGALEPTRDFTHVRDTARAFVAAAESAATIGQTTNTGSGFEISIGAAARLIAELLGIDDLEFAADSRRLRPPASEVERLWAATGRAAERMRWEPEFGGTDGFRRGLADTIAWYREPAHLALFKAHEYGT
jgi:dTDP-glucose 4,6-dehydratase